MSLTRRQVLLLGAAALTAPTPEAKPAPSKIRDYHSETAPSGLTCCLLTNPVRVQIGTLIPTFSWIVNSSGSNVMQRAYQVQVNQLNPKATDSENPIWDSGKKLSPQSTAVLYSGPTLKQNTQYAWRVRSWIDAGDPSAWSTSQSFNTGSPDPANRITTATYPIVQTRTNAVQTSTIAPGHILLDFGKDAFAGLQLTVDSTACALTVHLGESLTSGGGVNRAPGGSVRYHKAVVPINEGTQTITVPLTASDARKMTPEVGPVMPFRYVEIENIPANAKVDAVQVAAHYPFDDNVSSFDSSSAALNSVWALSKYTIKATSFAGIFVDGDRERHPYEADAYINQLGYYYADREYSLARYSHEYLILNPTWPTEWIMHSVLIAWADYLYTGDLNSIKAFYTDLKAKSLMDLAGDDGLISSGNITPEILNDIHGKRIEDIVDWPAAERDNFEMKPINTVVNAFHYRALVLLEHIAIALDNDVDAALYKTLSEKIYSAFNEKLFDQPTGLYVDGLGSSHSSLHANMFALAFGLTPDSALPKIADFIQSKNMACSVYGAQYLLEACYAAGLSDYAYGLLTSADETSWLHMVNDVGATMTTEAWDAKLKPNQDWNHAWGAAPANIIPRFIMGIEPIAPGYQKARIRPQLGPLSSANIKVPTIRGTILAAYVKSTSSFALTVTIPANMSAEVWLPAAANGSTALRIDGAVASGTHKQNYVVIDNIGSGSHKIELIG